jgi:hypothetical protein
MKEMPQEKEKEAPTIIITTPPITQADAPSSNDDE